MEIEYKITYKTHQWKYWGQLAGSFENYTDAETEFNRLLKEGSSGIYRIIKITYEVVREEETTK